MADTSISTGFMVALAVLGCAAAATLTPAADADLSPAQDPSLWTDDDFVPFNGDRFDGFDWRLCNAVSRSSPGNVVLSPVGLKVLLAMLYEGAAGTTAAEIKDTLQLPEPRQNARLKFSAVLESLQEPHQEYALDIATRVYVDTSVTPRQRFLKILKYFYSTDVDPVNFSQARETTNKINAWVEGATNGHISNFVKEESLGENVLMLLNAIYFKGTWRYTFDEDNTFKGRFQTSPGRFVQVDYMKQQFDSMYYADSELLDAQIIRLPYMGKKFSMFVVLPNKPSGLPLLMNSINPTLVRQLMRNMSRPDLIEVILPKFKFDFTSDLDGALQELGIAELFTDRASLPGVASGRGARQLYVSNVRQKAGLEVSEKGTTAFAATEVSLVNKFGETLVFNASQPFLFFIEDETTGTVLFVGKVTDPTQVSQSSTSTPRPGGGRNPRPQLSTRIDGDQESAPAPAPSPRPLYPINTHWGWNRPGVATRTGNMPDRTPAQVPPPTAVQFPQLPLGPLYPASTVPLQGFPRIIYYPIVLYGWNK